jgi:hypothetical protein
MRPHAALPSAHDRCQAEEAKDQADQKDIVPGSGFNEFPRIGEASEHGSPHEEDDADCLQEIGIGKGIPVGLLEVQTGNGSWLLFQDLQHEKSYHELRNSVDQVDQPPGADIRQCASYGRSRCPAEEHHAEDFSQGVLDLLRITPEAIPDKRHGHGKDGSGKGTVHRPNDAERRQVEGHRPKSTEDGRSEGCNVNDPGLSVSIGKRPEEEREKTEWKHISRNRKGRQAYVELKVFCDLDNEGRCRIVVPIAPEGHHSQNKYHFA